MQKPIKDAVNTLLEVFKNSDVSLFVGAGISMEHPANLPSADALKWSILRMISGKERNVNDNAEIFQHYLSTTMLELMIQEIAEIMGKRAYELLRVFSYGEPNLNHLFVAKLAHHRFINNIWTTNFDTLIERALVNEGVAYQSLSTDHDFADYLISPEKYPDFLIFKLHGTVSFGKNSLGVEKNKIVELITPLKFEIRKLRKSLKESGVEAYTYGFNRQVTTEDTMVGSLTRVGFGLSEWCRKVFEEFLDKSTFIVMGWSGFDLDVSPVLLQGAKNVYWLNHTPEKTSDKAADSVSAEDLEHAYMEQDIRQSCRNDTEIELALLMFAGRPQRDVIPSAHREIYEKIVEPRGHLWDLFTPTLVRELWISLASDFGPLPDISKDADRMPKEPLENVQSWGNSIDPFIRDWMLGRWFINHGEFENTNFLLSEQLLPGAELKNILDIKAMLYLDLGVLNSLSGKRSESKRCFTKAIQIYENDIMGCQSKNLSGYFDPGRLAEIPDRANFALGILETEFYNFKEARPYFEQANYWRYALGDSAIRDALIAYCDKDFELALSAMYKRNLRLDLFSMHHYEVYCFLESIRGKMLSAIGQQENAMKTYRKLLDISTKIGWARYKVLSLNGLIQIYAQRGNVLKQAKYAFHAIEVANMAEYRVGRAFAGYYMGQVHSLLRDKAGAKGAFEYSQKMFTQMEHQFGINECREAIRWHTGSYATFATETDIPLQIWDDSRNDFRVGRLAPVPKGLVKSPCRKCGKPKLSGAIICTPDGKPVIESADDDDPNILCLSCGYWYD